MKYCVASLQPTLNIRDKKKFKNIKGRECIKWRTEGVSFGPTKPVSHSITSAIKDFTQKLATLSNAQSDWYAFKNNSVKIVQEKKQ